MYLVLADPRLLSQAYTASEERDFVDAQSRDFSLSFFSRRMTFRFRRQHPEEEKAVHREELGEHQASGNVGLVQCTRQLAVRQELFDEESLTSFCDCILQDSYYGTG